jgi:F-type H+-transporting ATPase subunit gamma
VEIYDPKTGEPRHPLLVQRPEKNVLLIVVTGDKGLAGAFNTNILKAATRFLQSKTEKNIEIEAIGKKGRDFLRRRYPTAEPRNAASTDAVRTTIVGEQIGVLNKVEYSAVSELVNRVIDRYSKAEIDSVYVVYNEFKSVIAQRLIVEQVLPIEKIGEPGVLQSDAMSEKDRRHAIEAAKEGGVSLRAADTKAIDEEAAKFATEPVDYIYEQPPEVLFRSLLPKYIGMQIYRGLMESVAAEHAARMTAMDSATNNASDMIDSLTLVMNRARQAKITKEIIEIVSGAAAAQ